MIENEIMEELTKQEFENGSYNSIEDASGEIRRKLFFIRDTYDGAEEEALWTSEEERPGACTEA